ncbi:MAG TPA: DNA primase [Steroidobacteraceae bacterium]|jgi:DNA primase|nr:DNA primase [Steroidobacteraceae bacterium]
MAGRIAQRFIDELIARADIVELIGNRVPLKRAGREYKACCPFHDEKTPSFWVSPDKQFYHCFGCGAHGTALTFLMEYDRLPFPEAVEDLATRLGLTVEHEAPSPHFGAAADPGARGAGTAGAAAGESGEADAQATRTLYELLAHAAELYRTNLAGNARARAYAEQRGLSAQIIERFGIGYAADSWNDVLRRLGTGEAAQRALAAAGLVIERDSGGSANASGGGEETRTERSGAGSRYYDRFRDRLMFPIRDTRGRVIAFGGRVLGDGEPKYLNSPETVLFHKGKELYGLYETRLARRGLTRLLVVEGYMDTVQLHQHGLTYAVATLGTATTPEHVRRAFRLVSEVVFCFDGDRAGRAAAWRALQMVLPEARAGREVRFLFLPDGEDPDSLVGREGGERFEARITAALPLSEYLVAQLAEQADVSHADGKARFIALARPLLDKVAPGVYRELLLERIAVALELPASRLQQWLAGPAPPEGQAARAAGAAAVHSAAGQRAPAGRQPGRGSLVTQAIALLLHFPGAAAAVSTEQREALAGIPLPGVAALNELLAQLGAQPSATMAQTLERWRDRHEYRRLCELAAAAPLVPDGGAAARELSEAVRRLLVQELPRRRLEALIEKARVDRLDDAEKLELQALTTDQAAGTGGSGKS